MRFVDDDKVVIGPIDSIQRDAVRIAAGAGQIGMVQNVIVEPIARQNVGFQVVSVGEPVVG